MAKNTETVTSNTVLVTPKADHAFEKDAGVTLWGFQFNIVNKILVAEMSKEDSDNFVKAGHVKVVK